jgi:DNA (cytosine-5)-methyltransferase 1
VSRLPVERINDITALRFDLLNTSAILISEIACRSPATNATLQNMRLTAVELCAGAGGQALGMELAGFHHGAVVEYEPQFCTTLRKNRPHWDVRQQDIRDIDGGALAGADVIAAGVPCPPFSVAGKQLGHEDDRDMFPAALRIVERAKPRAVLFENVPGLASARFETYRRKLIARLGSMGYQTDWKVIQAADFGVPQLRPRFVLVALRPSDAEHFCWPIGSDLRKNVGDTLRDLMAENSWHGAEAWAEGACGIAPTIVGGSKKHGGPDLGPTRAKRQWRTLGVDGMGIADSAPAPDAPFDYVPRLTLRMVARLQSFPDEWNFTGGKTAAYRQIGNAFPPNVAKAVASAVRAALARSKRHVADAILDPQLRFLEPPSKYPKTSRRKHR